MPVPESLRNAAIVLNNLPKHQAAKIMSRLDAKDLKSVFRVIGELDQLNQRQIFQALQQLARDAQRLHGNCKLASPPTRRVTVSEALHAGKFSDDLQDSNGDPFAFLLSLEPELVSHILHDEHPKNIAIVLSCLPSESSALHLRGVEPVVRVSVIKRMCDIGDIDPAEASSLAYALRVRLQKLRASQQSEAQGVSLAARLVNLVDAESREDLMVRLRQDDPDLADRLQQTVLEFNDLARLSDADMRTLLKAVDTACWAPALKYAPAGIKYKVLSNMAERPAAMLNDEMRKLVRLDGLTAKRAQQSVVQTCLRLIDSRAIDGAANKVQQVVLPVMGVPTPISNPVKY